MNIAALAGRWIDGHLDRYAATIILVDSSLQRENILPSERAKAEEEIKLWLE